MIKMRSKRDRKQRKKFRYQLERFAIESADQKGIFSSRDINKMFYEEYDAEDKKKKAAIRRKVFYHLSIWRKERTLKRKGSGRYKIIDSYMHELFRDVDKNTLDEYDAKTIVHVYPNLTVYGVCSKNELDGIKEFLQRIKNTFNEGVKLTGDNWDIYPPEISIVLHSGAGIDAPTRYEELNGYLEECWIFFGDIDFDDEKEEKKIERKLYCIKKQITPERLTKIDKYYELRRKLLNTKNKLGDKYYLSAPQ